MPTKKKNTGNAVRISAKTKKKTARTIEKSPQTTTVTRTRRTVSASKISSRIGLNLGMHLLISGSAIAVLLLLGMVDRATFSTLLSRAASETPSTIGLEFTESLRLSVLIARKSQTGYASIKNDSTQSIRVSVPMDWKRTEVSGATLAEVVSDEPVFGFVRWTLPADSEIRFLMPKVPTTLFFDTTSKSTAAINIKTIDLGDSSVSDLTVLLKDKVLARLWESEE